MDLAEQNKQKHRYQKRNKMIAQQDSGIIGPRYRGKAWVIIQRD